MDREGLGPAEQVLKSMLTFGGHMMHGRPGVVLEDGSWKPTKKVKEGDSTVLYATQRQGKKVVLTKLGTLRGNEVWNGKKVGEFRRPGIVPEVAGKLYRQVADVWALDNEFAARWASYMFSQDNKDVRVIMAAFMLVQSRRGDPIVEAGKRLFDDVDFRDVGEAICLTYGKVKGLDPKQILRVRAVLRTPQVAAINRELGFGRSATRPFLGRWPAAAQKWLRYREQNPVLLKAAVKAGWKRTIRQLACEARFKAATPEFYRILEWSQDQSEAGHRMLAIGEDMATGDSWADLDEVQVCMRIEAERPGYKRLSSLVGAGLTRAMMACAIESGCLSDAELVIASATIEDLGLLKVQDIKARWEAAVARAVDARAANVARNIRSQAAKETLLAGADKAVQKAVEEVAKNIRVYVIVDKSSSMHCSIERAKEVVAKVVSAFPLERVHVAVFDSRGREVTIPHASARGVQQAFIGIAAGGQTNYGAGIEALAHYRPRDDEDALVIAIGDSNGPRFTASFTRMGWAPMAFGFVPVGERTLHQYSDWGECVERTATALGVPCFIVDEETFVGDDPYAVHRTIRNLVAATPVGQTPGRATKRVSLVDTVMKTELLTKPVWA